jgi:hypothetical protein
MASKLNQSMLLWLVDIAPWSHAVTVTFKKNRDGRPVTANQMSDTIRHLCNLIDRACYRSRARRGKNRIGSFAVYDLGPFGNHPHAHMTLAAPIGLGHREFSRIIRTAINRTALLDRQFDIKSFTNEGWIRYCLKHQDFELNLELVRPPKY